jgi:hypothetical protein
VNVFHRDGATVRHFWGSELFHAPTDPGQDPRDTGTIEPLSNLFDLTPEGRDDDFDEQLDDDATRSGNDSGPPKRARGHAVVWRGNSVTRDRADTVRESGPTSGSSELRKVLLRRTVLPAGTELNEVGRSDLRRASGDYGGAA